MDQHLEDMYDSQFELVDAYLEYAPDVYWEEDD
jgi:hypothetical protein